MKMHRRLVPVITVGLTLSGVLATAQNLVGNGDFDTVVTGWTAYHCLLQWDPADSDSSTTSGSARLSNDNDVEPTTAIFGCADGVIAGQSYDLGGRVWIPTGQPSNGSAKLGIYWHEDTGCAGSATLAGQTPSVQLLGGWVSLALFGLVAPPGAQSALVTAYNIKTTPGTGPFVVHHDGVYLGVFGGIFTDGFESGSTSLWSAAVP